MEHKIVIQKAYKTKVRHNMFKISKCIEVHTLEKVCESYNALRNHDLPHTYKSWSFITFHWTGLLADCVYYLQCPSVCVCCPSVKKKLVYGMEWRFLSRTLFINCKTKPTIVWAIPLILKVVEWMIMMMMMITTMTGKTTTTKQKTATKTTRTMITMTNPWFLL